MAAINNDKPSISTIGMALAGKSESVDIPKPTGAIAWDGKDTFAAVAARSAPTKGHRAGLPTPPNSISPSLPPHAFKDTLDHDPLTPPAHGTESDIDLQDAVEHAVSQDQPTRGYVLGSDSNAPEAVDSTGSITSTLLATHHLPGILLAHGPLAIRHIMGYLTTSVPGFSGIPAAKARRIVVGALEGRGGEAAGGLDGDVVFEKVGWGRWDARRRGQPSKHASRQSSPIATRPHAHPPSPYSRTTFHIPHRPRNPRNRQPSSTSLSVSRRSENEVDHMSMDGDGSASCSEAPEDPYPEDDEGEVTDEEDWASIGAAALRAGFSFPKGSVPKGGKYDYNERVRRESSAVSHRKRTGGGPASSALAKSAPALDDSDMKDLMEGVTKDEGEAVRALLQMGGM